MVEDVHRKVRWRWKDISLFLFSVNLGTPASQGYDNTYTVAAAAFERGTIP